MKVFVLLIIVTLLLSIWAYDKQHKSTKPVERYQKVTLFTPDIYIPYKYEPKRIFKK